MNRAPRLTRRERKAVAPPPAPRANPFTSHPCAECGHDVLSAWTASINAEGKYVPGHKLVTLDAKPCNYGDGEPGSYCAIAFHTGMPVVAQGVRNRNEYYTSHALTCRDFQRLGRA